MPIGTLVLTLLPYPLTGLMTCGIVMNARRSRSILPFELWLCKSDGGSISTPNQVSSPRKF